MLGLIRCIMTGSRRTSCVRNVPHADPVTWRCLIADGCPAVSVLRGQDEPVFSVQEDRAVRLPPSTLRVLLGRGESPCASVSQQVAKCETALLIHCGNYVICRKMYYNCNKRGNNNQFSHSSKLQSPRTNIHSQTFLHFIPASSSLHPHLVFICLLVDCVSDQQLVR